MTRPWCWLSTLRRGHCWPPRKTRFRRLARPCRVGLVTHRVATKGFKDATPYPPFLSFAWRNGTPCFDKKGALVSPFYPQPRSQLGRDSHRSALARVATILAR